MDEEIYCCPWRRKHKTATLPDPRQITYGLLVCPECVVTPEYSRWLYEDYSKIDPLSTQIGGDHYRGFALQPVEFITKNKLSFLQGCIVKRICRYNKPGGKGKEDLSKIKHEIDLILALDSDSEV